MTPLAGDSGLWSTQDKSFSLPLVIATVVAGEGMLFLGCNLFLLGVLLKV